MPRIRCHYVDCVFNDEGICSASSVEIDPDAGCLTYAQSTQAAETEWDEEDEEELEEDWEDIGFDEEEEEDEDWLDDDDFEGDDDF